jgi:hypothetical protein
MRGHWRVTCSVSCTTIWILRVRLRAGSVQLRDARGRIQAQRLQVGIEDAQLAPGCASSGPPRCWKSASPSKRWYSGFGFSSLMAVEAQVARRCHPRLIAPVRRAQAAAGARRRSASARAPRWPARGTQDFAVDEEAGPR